MSDYQLTFPFLHHDDDADELARVIVSKVVDIVHQQAAPDFHWSESAHLELCRVRATFAEMLRPRLRQPR
jgi:hypothetical protein